MKDHELRRSASFMVGIGWLSERPSKARLRVIRFIELLKTADLLSRELRRRNETLPAKTPEARKLLSTLDSATQILQLHKGTVCLGFKDDYQIEELFAYNRKRLESDDVFYIETHIMNYALSLMREGSIQRVRVCRECKTWFYAMTEHQKHCSDKCRQRFASRDASFKEHRRNYMREYRRNERQRDQDMKRVARITS